MMKQSLQLRLKQQLTLTPQLQQAIRLLQLSTLELNQEIEQALQDNPLLEQDDSERDQDGVLLNLPPEETQQAPIEAAPPEDVDNVSSPEDNLIDQGDIWGEDYAANGTRTRDDDDESEYTQVAMPSPSIYEHLESQLRLISLSDRDHALVSLLIEELDETGFLPCSLEELQAELPAELEIDLDELQIALRYLQTLEPTGVGARDLKECLLLQLKLFPESEPVLALARRIIENCLELFAVKDYNRIKKQMLCDDDELRSAYQLITRLNPRPGAAYGQEETRYVVPDVIVRKIKNEWVVNLNPQAMPRLRINEMYASILHKNRDGGAGLSNQLQEARWLIKNVQQRFETILRVTQAIVNRQIRFFEYGAVAMKPLILRDIADELGLHESTISRVTTQKYMLTPGGVFELKYFFGSHVDTDTGGECSAIAIRALIKQLIAAEDAKKPLSDSQISELLGKQGIVVARRTVAKYREALQIPPVAQRKSI